MHWPDRCETRPGLIYAGAELRPQNNDCAGPADLYLARGRRCSGRAHCRPAARRRRRRRHGQAPLDAATCARKRATVSDKHGTCDCGAYRLSTSANWPSKVSDEPISGAHVKQVTNGPVARVRPREPRRPTSAGALAQVRWRLRAPK